jgi:hypothetical protein
MFILTLASSASQGKPSPLLQPPMAASHTLGTDDDAAAAHLPPAPPENEQRLPARTVPSGTLDIPPDLHGHSPAKPKQKSIEKIMLHTGRQ